MKSVNKPIVGIPAYYFGGPVFKSPFVNGLS